MNAAARGLYWAEESCLALAHRWEPERIFVIFTAYFDEADTHGPLPTVILAAHFGHAYQWRQFEKKLIRIQERDGFTVFHAKDFKAKVGEFEGWSDDKCQRLLDDLTQLGRNNLTAGITVALERDLYLSEYRAPPIPRKMHLDSQYGVCFRACLAHLMTRMQERGFRDRLHVVMEGGHTNVWDCGRIFNDIKARSLRLGFDFLGSFTVEEKATCRLLMISDLLGAVHSGIRAHAPNYVKTAPRPKSGEAALTFVSLDSNALRGLKVNFKKARQQEIDEWRAKRAARKALISSR